MSQIRNPRFLYESEDIVVFTNHPTLCAIFDELEKINYFRQSLAVALFFNPKMIIDVVNLIQWKDSIEYYAPLLVKRLQTARIVTNKKRLGISNDEPSRATPQEIWMMNILYKDVDYWRTQKYWKENESVKSLLGIPLHKKAG
ncbi:hypothetical protein Bca4012_028055 [Brassica carinata]